MKFFESLKELFRNKKFKFTILITATVGALAVGVTVNLDLDAGEAKLDIYPLEITVTPEDVKPEIELSEEQVTATIETDEGIIEVIEAPTVEAVDAPLPEGIDDTVGGQGAYYDVSSPDKFYKATLGKCIDQDGYYGSQCWDLADAIWENLAGRRFSTCGTGAAKGSLNCYKANSGSDFSMVWDAKKIQKGDIVVFTNGVYGHVGMALGSYNKGYVSLLGTNQGGKACGGGGSAANVINISLKYFGGAFRAKAWSNTKKYYVVKKGDNLTKIAKSYKTTVKKLVSLNKLKNANYLKIGQRLRVK